MKIPATYRIGFLAALAVALVAQRAHAQVIRLQQAITVEPHADVRLGDLATISGTDQHTAEELANTVILTGVDSTRKVKAESVLLALMSQRGVAGASMINNLQWGGAAQCAVQVAPRGGSGTGAGGAESSDTIAAMSPQTAGVDASLVAVPAVAPLLTTSADKGAAAPAKSGDRRTLVQLINEKAWQDSGLSPEHVRITIDTISPLLEAPVAPGRQWLCRPLTHALIGTVQFEAQLVEGPRIIQKLNVETKIEWWQMSVVAVARLDRGDVVTPAAVEAREVWLDRKLPTLFLSDKDVIGLEAQRSIDPGSMLDQRDFKPAMMALKGDSILVYFLSGALRVQVRARAMEDGKLHDPVQVKNENTNEIYQATLIGKRIAVVGGTLSEADEKRLREAR